jgi:hypothetical protein
MTDGYPGTEKDRSVHELPLHHRLLYPSILPPTRRPMMSRSRSLQSTVLEGRGPPPEASSIRSPPKTRTRAKQKLRRQRIAGKKGRTGAKEKVSHTVSGSQLIPCSLLSQNPNMNRDLLPRLCQLNQNRPKQVPIPQHLKSPHLLAHRPANPVVPRRAAAVSEETNIRRIETQMGMEWIRDIWPTRPAAVSHMKSAATPRELDTPG